MAKAIWRAGKIGVTLLLTIFVIGVVLYSAKHLAFGEVELIQPSATLLEITSDARIVSGYIKDPNAIPLGNTTGDILRIADHCLNSGNYNYARQLYSQLSIGSADESVRLSAFKGMVILDSVALEDPNAIPMTVKDLKAGFANHPGLPGAIFDIAEHYHNKALKIGRKSQKPVADALLQQAIPLLEEAIVTIPERQQSKAYMMIAESYGRLGNHRQALAYYQDLLDKHPDYEYAWHVYFLMGRCFEGMARSGVITDLQSKEQVIQIYTYLLEYYPDCKAANAASKWLDRNAL